MDNYMVKQNQPEQKVKPQKLIQKKNRKESSAMNNSDTKVKISSLLVKHAKELQINTEPKTKQYKTIEVGAKDCQLQTPRVSNSARASNKLPNHRPSSAQLSARTPKNILSSGNQIILQNIKTDYQSITAEPKSRKAPALTMKKSTSTRSNLVQARKRGLSVGRNNVIPILSINSPRPASLQSRSIISSASQDNLQRFKARAFVDRANFMVKKSIKNLTIPEQFNLNTQNRAANRSHSKSFHEGNTPVKEQIETFAYKPQTQNSNSGSSAKLKGHRRAQSHQKSTIFASNGFKNQVAVTNEEPQSLLSQLLKEYDLENEFKAVKDQFGEGKTQLSSTFGGSLKFEDCYIAPRQ